MTQRLVFLLLITWANSLFASEPRALSELPKIEIGAGLATLNLPDYPGADQRNYYVLPFPYVIYRGERLQAGRDGIRGMLFSHPRVDLDISAGGSLPVNSEDNRARSGMDDLDFSFEVGPSLRFKMRDRVDEKFQLRLNLRALLAIDGFPSADYEGWVFNPELRWWRYIDERFMFGVGLQARYGSREYHQYFYGVAPQFATSDRPAYQAGRGYNSTGANVFMRWKINGDWRLAGGIGVYDLHDAEFDDSPLFKRNNGAYIGFSVSRILWRSSSRAMSLDEDG